MFPASAADINADSERSIPNCKAVSPPPRLNSARSHTSTLLNGISPQRARAMEGARSITSTPPGNGSPMASAAAAAHPPLSPGTSSPMGGEAGRSEQRRSHAVPESIGFETGNAEEAPVEMTDVLLAPAEGTAVGVPAETLHMTVLRPPDGDLQTSLLAPPADSPVRSERAHGSSPPDSGDGPIDGTLGRTRAPAPQEEPIAAVLPGPSSRPPSVQEPQSCARSDSKSTVKALSAAGTPANNNSDSPQETQRVYEADDALVLNVTRLAQFTPPSSLRGADDNADRASLGRPQPGDGQKQQVAPPLSAVYQREGSSSARGLTSPSLSLQQLESSGRSGREIVSPCLGSSLAGDQGSNGNVAHGGQAYRAMGSNYSHLISAEDRQPCRVQRSKSFSEGVGPGAAGGGGDGAPRGAGSRLLLHREDTSGSGYGGSFMESGPQRSPAGGNSARGLQGSSFFDRNYREDSGHTINSRMSSPGFTRSFGSPASTNDYTFSRSALISGGGGTGGGRASQSGDMSRKNHPRRLSFQRGRTVGSGGFGTVFQAILSDGLLAAVKELKLETSNLKAIDREIQTMSSLPPHPNCVRYFGSRHSKHHYYIIMEYISGGSIYSLRQTVGRFRESVFQRYAYMVLLGLEHLHECGIIHRDIKGANVLLDERGCAKIVDFGCCKNLNQGVQTIGGGGTPLWMAPEVCRGEEASVKSDVWAFGCLCLEMTNETGLPWSFPTTMTVQGIAYALASAKKPPPIPTTLSEVAQDFVACCVRLDAEDRLDVPQLLSHPFFDIDYESESDGSEEDLIASRDQSAKPSVVRRKLGSARERDDDMESPLNASMGRPLESKRYAPALSGPVAQPSTDQTPVQSKVPNVASSMPAQQQQQPTPNSLMRTINGGFHLDAVDARDSDSDSSDSAAEVAMHVGAGKAAARPPGNLAHGDSGRETEDMEYMATVNDIISRARENSQSTPPSTASLGFRTAATRAPIGTAVSSSSSFASRSRSPSSHESTPTTSPPRSSLIALQSQPHSSLKVSAHRSVRSEVQAAGGASEIRCDSLHLSESTIPPPEPQGGTKPHRDRVVSIDNASSTASTPASHSPTVSSKTFQRRTTFPVGSSSSSTNPSHEGPSAIAPKTSGATPTAVKASSAFGATHPEPLQRSATATGTLSAKSIQRGHAPVSPSLPSPNADAAAMGSPTFTFTSGSQGHVMPVRRGARVAPSSDQRVGKTKEKHSSTTDSKNSLPKESSAIRETRDIIGFTRSDSAATPSLSSEPRSHGEKDKDKDKKKSGLSKWFR